MNPHDWLQGRLAPLDWLVNLLLLGIIGMAAFVLFFVHDRVKRAAFVAWMYFP